MEIDLMSGIFGRSRGSRIRASDLQRRIGSLEQQLVRFGGRASARGSEMFDDIAERLRGSTSSMGKEAIRYGNDAAKLGNNALRRLSQEVETRPLPTLVTAVGFGILIALLLHRRN